MKGYLNNKSATRKSITSDGWFKTGDVTIRDGEGFYTIVDRKKELIKYKVRALAFMHASPSRGLVLTGYGFISLGLPGTASGA